MMLVIGRRIFRLLIFTLVLLFSLPVLQFYFLRALDPHYVQLWEPQGRVLKVTADMDDEEAVSGMLRRIQYFLHDFYQNGL